MKSFVDGARTRVASLVRDIVVGEPTSPRETAKWDPADPGLFAPDHIVRVVHSDAAMFIGGVRSILLQSLHPAAMYGVARHSRFRDDPLGRLHRTASFLGQTTFGSGSEADRAIEMVRRVHVKVEGTMPDGTPYSAGDPHLLEWVHITEVASFLKAFRRYGSTRITDAQADEYVDGMAEVGMRLGMTNAPHSVKELDAAIERFRPELATTSDSQEASLFLLNPPLPLAAKPAYAIVFGAALASLPYWAQSLLLMPLPPLASRVAIRPAATVLTRSLQWALLAQTEESSETIAC